LNRGEARRLGVPIDYKRKSAHEENVNTLKAHKEKAPPVVPKPKPVVEKLVETKKKPKS
jgi:ribosomal protein L13E